MRVVLKTFLLQGKKKTNLNYKINFFFPNADFLSFFSSLFFVTFPFIVNLGFAFKAVFDELMRHDFRRLLEKIRTLKDELKEKDGDVNESELNNDRRELINKAKGNEKVDELTKALKETGEELIRIDRELKEVSKLAKELKGVNVNLEKLKDNSNEINVNDIVKKLTSSNDLIDKLTQVEDFSEELVYVSKHLDELEKLLKEFKDINNEELEEIVVRNEDAKEVNEPTNEIVTKEIGEEFKTELGKIKELMGRLKGVEEFKGQLSKAVNFMNALKEKDFTSKMELMKQLEKLDVFKKELEKISIIEFKEEAKEFNDHADFTAVYTENNNIMEVKQDTTEAQKGEENKRLSNIWGGIKRFGKIFIDTEGVAEEFIEKGQPEKKYRKFSKWLRDHKDNQIVVVIFTILAGVDISHLELLGSKLRISIPSLNLCCYRTKSVDINFNAKLSYAAKRNLFLGDVTNIFIEDVSVIFIQVCKLFLH
jgi:hypothetical protein